MTTIDEFDTRTEAVLSLRDMGDSYRKLAEEAANSEVWADRLRLAARFEREAAALEHLSVKLQRRIPGGDNA